MACATADYARLAIPFAPVPDRVLDLRASLDAEAPFGNTPTGPALGGAIASASAYVHDHPGHAAAVVLVTDGLPTDCGMNAAAVADRASREGIRTFVIGLFSPAEEAEARATLDLIAARGGTGLAMLITTTADVTTSLLAALDTVRKRALPCEYALPKAEAGVVDPTKVDVVVTPPGAASVTVPFVPDGPTCADGAGWHYAKFGTAAPSKIVLCPRTCETLAKADETAKVEIVTECQTVLR